jgi:hypothetical protein
LSRAERRAAARNAEAMTVARQLARSKPGSMDRSNLLGKARRMLAQHEAGAGALGAVEALDLQTSVRHADADSKRHDAFMDHIGKITGVHPYDHE